MSGADKAGFWWGGEGENNEVVIRGRAHWSVSSLASGWRKMLSIIFSILMKRSWSSAPGGIGSRMHNCDFNWWDLSQRGGPSRHRAIISGHQYWPTVIIPMPQQTSWLLKLWLLRRACFQFVHRMWKQFRALQRPGDGIDTNKVHWRGKRFTTIHGKTGWVAENPQVKP